MAEPTTGTTKVILGVALIGAFGGWLIATGVQSWGEVFAVKNVGALLVSFASVIGAWLARSTYVQNVSNALMGKIKTDEKSSR